MLFLVRGPRDRAGWLALAALGVSYLFYIWMIPDNWYGGSGTLGNRYFLNLLPLALFLVPRGARVAGGRGRPRRRRPSSPGPCWRRRSRTRCGPGDTRIAAPFRALPAELTMLNDLAVFTEPWRKKQPFGDTEGDAHKHWPADPKAYYLYFPDDGTYGRRSCATGVEGFWLRGGRVGRGHPARAGAGDARHASASSAGRRATTSPCGSAGPAPLRRVAPAQRPKATLDASAPFVYKDSFVYVLRFRSRRDGGRGPDGRAARPAPS